MYLEKTLTAAIVLGLFAVGAATVPTAATAGSGKSGTRDSILCAPPAVFDPPQGRCAIVPRTGLPKVQARPRALDQARFDRWRIERGVFSLVEMNGVMER